jgi:hypothetical protein
MKGNVMSSMVQVEPELLKNLVTEVKETIATDVQECEEPKRFTVVDMWNIRRNSVSARSRFKG